MKKVLLFLVAGFFMFTATAEERVWSLQTEEGQNVMLADVDYLLAADDMRVFSIILKNGATVDNLRKVTVSDVTSVTTIEADNGLSLFPNPVRETLTLSGYRAGSEVAILSLDGKIIKQQQAEGESMTISVTDLASGCYLLKTENSVVKFIKK
ncbi:MAG: T9SS type A sorting domain-containing protein [Bacteroidaceae bacterium]|nr:T9SS type A sorting domain-containing protein [Bacteroidales bacterium]MBP3671233.1 T9SS type A sorting domain-containing protein [Bacteroidaceae bacterium]MBQ2978689.1 T9SS type A sorting domain-containing protein [Bacteroidaceae bacterium]